MGCDRSSVAVSRLDIFLAAFDDIPDPLADMAHHDLRKLLVVGFVAVLCGATNCAEMADFGRATVMSCEGSPESSELRDATTYRHDYAIGDLRMCYCGKYS